MKIVTKFQTEDGSMFDTETEALRHERIEGIANGLSDAGFDDDYEFDARKAVIWLLDNYDVEKKST